MAEKKFSIGDKVFLIILLCVLLALFGCASHTPKEEDSNHYRVQVQQPQGYPCPKCGLPIPGKDVNPNTRIENKCPYCQKIFFGKPTVKSKSNEQQRQGKPYQGPKVFVRGYYSDIKHSSNFDHLVKNTWKVSPDGSSGSMSQTFIRTYEHTTKGEHGTMVGPAGLGHYSGY